MGYNIGPKIGIDGENEFRNQLRKINDTYKALEAETKAVTKAFEAQGDEQGKLEALSKQLNKQIDEQKKKQALLEDAVKKATAKFGENSVEAIRLRGALYDTQSTIADLEARLSDTRKQLDNAGQSMEVLEESTEEATDSALSFKDVMGANLIADAVLDTIESAASGIKDFAKGSLEAAATINAAEAQFEQTFGAMQDAAKESLGAISQNVGVASTRMQESFTKIYAFAKTSGSDSAEALTIASRALSAAADSAAYYDRSIEETTESLQAFLKGNFANDSALGISCTETTRNTKANELYAKSFNQLTEAQKVDVLLAMVEAGNKASGAFGQAARESDSWGNVLGELSEMFRQLQANAGKGALKALTPVIKKITKAGYELIEDIDWEKFGKTVEDIVDGAIEYGPEVIRIVAAIAAGVATLKIAQQIANFGRMAKTFLTVGTASKKAATDVKASGAAAATSPWMMVASLIGAAVGYIAASSMMAEDTETKFEKVTEHLKSMQDSIEETFADAQASADGSAESVRRYVAQLEELEASGLQTAEAQQKYRDVVAQINEIMPELNLEIDENTGLLNQSTTAILKNVDALYDKAMQEAYYEKVTESVKLHAEATAEAASAEIRLAEVREEQRQLSEDVADSTSALEQIESELLEVETKLATQEGLSAKERNELTLQADNLRKRQKLLKGGAWDLYKAYGDLNQEEKDLVLTMAAATHSAEEASLEIAASEVAADNYAESVRNAALANQGLTDSQLAIKTSIENLVAGYEEAKIAAMDSINSQIGLFEELSAKHDWTADQIIKNWQSQQTAFANYTQNLEKAVDLELDQTLIQQLSDGSVESMQILDALVNDTKIDVEAINAEFEKTSEAKDNMASTMALIHTDSKEKWDAIVADAEEAGMDVATGAAEGVRENSWRFVQEISNMAADGQEWWNKIWDRHSPSRWMADASEDIVDGGANSIAKYSDRFAESLASMAQLGKASFLQEKLDVAVQYPDMVAASTVNNSRSVTHMGGFNIQIYQQPGESAENLAYRVMDIIHDEVAAKEAVFGAK